MRYRLSIATMLAGAVTAAAIPMVATAQERPITDRSVNAVDVATTPMSDLNIRKDEIPTMLLLAQADPYNVTQVSRCSQLAAAVGELDAILGDDLDLPQRGEDKISPGRVAQSVVGSFIPFRGIIREVSGANDQRRKLDAAIQAGVARRAFLKGYGQAKGCRYPARSLTADALAERNAAVQRAALQKPAAATPAPSAAPTIAAQPVVVPQPSQGPRSR